MYNLYLSGENRGSIHLPLKLLQRLPVSKREGVVATMAIHDPATGVLKRHIIRKVRHGYFLLTSLS